MIMYLRESTANLLVIKLTSTFVFRRKYKHAQSHEKKKFENTVPAH